MIITLVIPAKGTSERLPNKNLLHLRGKSLVRRACERALAAKTITHCYLDTESEAIIQDCQDLTADGLGILRRPVALATNDTTGNDLAVWELGALPPCDILCQTFATCPLLQPETIDRCVAAFCDHPKYDSFTTVVEMREYFWWRCQPFNFRLRELPNSQQIEPMLMETHGIYGVRADTLRELGTRLGRNPLMLRVSKREALDINDIDDLWMAERLLAP